MDKGTQLKWNTGTVYEIDQIKGSKFAMTRIQGSHGASWDILTQAQVDELVAEGHLEILSNRIHHCHYCGQAARTFGFFGERVCDNCC